MSQFESPHVLHHLIGLFFQALSRFPTITKISLFEGKKCACESLILIQDLILSKNVCNCRRIVRHDFSHFDVLEKYFV